MAVPCRSKPLRSLRATPSIQKISIFCEIIRNLYSFYNAMRKKSILLFVVFLLLGACKHTANNPQTDALLRAARDGHADAVQELLKSPDIDVNATDADGNTALIEAARFGHDHVARVLLAAGANTKVRDKNGKTPLMLAVAGGHDEVALALRQGGATE